ncbi:MAG: DeoR family transcriptional regulator [Bacteroidetes bacterium]|nr:MAG: DeoR family transcriptional regulator [Bacteroidota bacterium]REK06028.1 MAG: DeoR family transcriptional regulator [Bacteroidota bacterium]REK37086.1 MAG: DeoR family transcriptional regulator [Bacteroidota bacterium]REK47521.1 MAG: DeoR family transcriptional regulator [Bacteroidota bacterium]
MNADQQISILQRQVHQLSRRLMHLERDTRIVAQRQEYASTTEVMRLFKVSEATIRRRRQEGALTDYRVGSKGRGFQYSISQCEKVFSNPL